MLDNDFAIQLKPDLSDTRSVTVRFVLDFDGFGDILGIEILNLKDQLGMECLSSFEADIANHPRSLRYLYDEGSDALSLFIREGRSLSQRAVDGHVMLDNKGHIIGFKVRRPCNQ